MPNSIIETADSVLASRAGQDGREYQTLAGMVRAWRALARDKTLDDLHRASRQRCLETHIERQMELVLALPEPARWGRVQLVGAAAIVVIVLATALRGCGA